MNKFRADAVVRIRTGRLQLSDDQARRRLPSGQIVPVKGGPKGVYDIAESAEVQFKAGEEFAWDGDPGKAPGFTLLPKRKAASESTTETPAA